MFWIQQIQIRINPLDKGCIAGLQIKIEIRQKTMDTTANILYILNPVKFPLLLF